MSFAEDLTCKNCGQFICVLDIVTEAYNEIVQCLQRGDFEDIEFATHNLMEVQCDDCNHSVNPEEFAEWVASNIKIGSKVGFDILGQKPMIMNVWEESDGRYRSRRIGRVVDENFENVAYEYLRLKATKEFDGAMMVTSDSKEFYLEVLTGEPAREFYEGQSKKEEAGVKPS